MIRIASQPKPSTPEWHKVFLKMVPAITAHAKISFRDLRVVEPGGEECCYYHPRTTVGGQLGPDVRDGYGP